MLIVFILSAIDDHVSFGFVSILRIAGSSVCFFFYNNFFVFQVIVKFRVFIRFLFLCADTDWVDLDSVFDRVQG